MQKGKAKRQITKGNIKRQKLGGTGKFNLKSGKNRIICQKT